MSDFFKPYDFDTVDMSEPKPTCRYGPTEYQAKRIVERANEILERELAKAQTLYGTMIAGEFRVCGEDHITHQAKVVQVERVGK